MLCCREDPASALGEAGAQPPTAEAGRAEGQPGTAVEAAGDVDEAELGVTQMMEQAGRGSDALAQLEASLRPIERYAVRIVEEVGCTAAYDLHQVGNSGLSLQIITAMLTGPASMRQLVTLRR